LTAGAFGGHRDASRGRTDRESAVIVYAAYLLSLTFFALVVVGELLTGGANRRSEILPLLLILTLLATASSLVAGELFRSEPTMLTAAWPYVPVIMQ
jgi:hypothetical protein